MAVHASYALSLVLPGVCRSFLAVAVEAVIGCTPALMSSSRRLSSPDELSIELSSRRLSEASCVRSLEKEAMLEIVIRAMGPAMQFNLKFDCLKLSTCTADVRLRSLAAGGWVTVPAGG